LIVFDGQNKETREEEKNCVYRAQSQVEL